MKLGRIALIVAITYVGLALVMDGLVGFFQPGTDVLRTFDEKGEPYDRVLAVFEDGDTLWVQSGHYFRGWYHRVLANPEVELIRDGVATPYTAVPLDDAQTRAHLVGVMKAQAGFGYYVARVLLLFAPIKPVRLDPRNPAT